MKIAEVRVLGRVTEEERDEIRALYQRKIALKEIVVALATNEAALDSSLYERVVKDMGEASERFSNWFEKTSAKYNWDNIAGYQWQIDFGTCEVILKAASGQ